MSQCLGGPGRAGSLHIPQKGGGIKGKKKVKEDGSIAPNMLLFDQRESKMMLLQRHGCHGESMAAVSGTRCGALVSTHQLWDWASWSPSSAGTVSSSHREG